MYQLILLGHVVAAVMIIVLVLIQHGKGADMGAAFGSGASQTVFGSQGTGSFLLKVTGGLAGLFFATSLMLNYLVTVEVKKARDVSVPQTKVSQPLKKVAPEKTRD